jgi:hypothetical protein
VLRGFRSLLDQVSCCELEVAFTTTYEAQPTAQTVFEFMFDAGFGLFDLKVFGVRGTRHAIQANAYFCRRKVGSVRERCVETMFRLACGFSMVY